MSDLELPDRDDADAKAWFYLDNRADIEVWAALRADGRQVLDRYLVAAAPLIEELAEALGAEPDGGEVETGAWPRTGLRRTSWQHEGVHDVRIVVGWDRATLLTPGRNEWPWVGVCLPSDLADSERRKKVAEALKPVHAAMKGQTSQGYPYWRSVQPPAGPLNPDALVRDILASFQEIWEVAAPALDALHA